MPLTRTEKGVMRSMKQEYGPDKGKRVFYASAQAGKLGPATKARHGSAAKGSKQR